MVRKLKSFKSVKPLQFVKRREVMIDEEYGIPLKSLTPMQLLRIESDIQLVKPPKKQRKATAEEKAEFEKDNPSVSKALLKDLKIIEIDYTDEDYLAELKEKDVNQKLMQWLVYVDMKAKIGKECFWENIGLESEKDYEGLVTFLFDEEKGIGLGEEFLNSLILSIKGLKSDTISEKLADFDNIFKGLSSFDMLETLTKIQKEVEKKSDENADAGTE